MTDLVEIAFLGVMNANDRELSLPLTAWAERNLLRRRIKSALNALETAGYAVVPVEATEAMIDAACQIDGGPRPNPEAALIYRAMIAAAGETE